MRRGDLDLVPETDLGGPARREGARREGARRRRPTPEVRANESERGEPVGFEITLCGTVSIRAPGVAPAQLTSAQAQVALARLALERHGGTTRDQLADTLWPDGLPNTWSSALRSVVSRVRAFLAASLPPGAAPLQAHGGRYQLVLSEDTVVDVERATEAAGEAGTALAEGRYVEARRLAAGAAECLRAPLLPDYDGEWVTGLRYRLSDLLVTALERACVAASELGDHGAAVNYAEEAIRRAPLRESAHRCRMRAEARAGNRAEALRTYQQARRLLAEEVGVDPAPETEAAYLDLLGAPATAPAAGPTGASAGGAPVGGAPVPAAPAFPLPFVGREAELRALTAAWARAADGTGTVVLLTGEAGAGKTRLATEAARQVGPAGGLVLGGRCDRDATVPAPAFVEALGGHLAATPPDALPALDATTRRALAPLLVGAVAAALPVAEDATGGAAGDAGVTGAAVVGRNGAAVAGSDGAAVPDGATALVTGAGAGAAAGPGRAVEARADEPGDQVVTALVDLALLVARDRPLLLLLDDLHEADAATLRALRRLSRRVGDASLLVLATATEPPGDGSFAVMARDLDRDGCLHRLALPGLDEPEIRALARRALPDTPPDRRPAPDTLAADTAGNPYLLVELLRAHRGGEGPDGAGDHLPATVRDYATARLASLDTGPHDLLRAAAVAGAVFEPGPVADAAGLDRRCALDALDGLLAAGIVSEVPPQPGVAPRAHHYRFSHDVVRRAVRDQLSDAHRRHLHGRLADAIAAHHPGCPGHHARALADHRAAAAGTGGDRRAVCWAWRAAAQACEEGNLAEAVRLYRQGLAHVPLDDRALRAEALTGLGLAEAEAGRAEGGQTLLDGALLALRAGRLDVAARAALGLADAAAAGRADLGQEADALVDDLLSAATPGQARGRCAPGTIDEVTFARLVARQARAGRAPAPSAAPPAMAALARELDRLTVPDGLGRRRALAGELLTVATAVGDVAHQIVGAHHRATAAEVTGDAAGRDEALRALAAAVGDGDSCGDALLADHAVAVAVTQGRFTDAAATARMVAGLAGGRPARIDPVPGTLAARQVLVAGWLRGGSWLTGCRANDEPGNPVEASLVAVASGDRGRAHLRVRALATGAEPLPAGDEWPHVVGLLGLAAAELRDPCTADAMRDLLTPYADLVCGVGYRSFVGPVAFHLGNLAVVGGDWGDAERHLTAALGSLTGRGARPWVALAQRSLARALEGRGRPSDRRWVEALRADASTTVDDLGLRPERHPGHP